MRKKVIYRLITRLKIIVRKIIFYSIADILPKLIRNNVYVQFQNGVAELSQKAFAEPTDTICPARDAPILPKATHLKAGRTISEKIEIALPLEWKTPFDDCYKKEQRETPAEIKGFKLCLGVVEIGNVEIDDKGYISLQYLELQKLIGKQQFLCNDMIELE